MRFVLSRRGDYSIRALLTVGRHHGRSRVKARHIAENAEIPRGSLTKVLADLVGEGLLDARAGPQGGYELARHPDDITLLDIIDSVDGLGSDETCPLDGSACDDIDDCAVHDPWTDSVAAMRARLDSASLAELLDES